MIQSKISRRSALARTAGAIGALGLGAHAQEKPADAAPRGKQRLRVDQLQAWEALGYGMFIHFGMSTFVANELPDGTAPATTYAPTNLDVDQWVSVARDAGMKYAVLTTKHVAGHCLWPTKHTDYSVVNSGDKSDVVAKFVEACNRRGVKPGFYYCSWDNHNRFGSRTPSDTNPGGPPFTTSLYQDFQTAQITELLTNYGPICEMWIDIPGVLGRGYRTFLYNHVASLQPEIVIMMNSGISTGETYDINYAWPSDLIAIERRLPPATGHSKWRTIERNDYYMPGEVCDPIGKEWFYVEGDAPRPDEELKQMYESARAGGVNLLLDVPPDTRGLIPDQTVSALNRLSAHIR